MLRKLWMHVLIAFDDNYTFEGFKRTNKKFDLPDNLMHMEPAIKRKLTICNLFANQKLSIKDICVVLDASKHQVVDALIEQNLIKERRKKRRKLKGKSGSLSITPDSTSEDLEGSNSVQDSNTAKKTGKETESNIYENPSFASGNAGSKNPVDSGPPKTRRIA
jgi:hypothetical protein